MQTEIEQNFQASAPEYYKMNFAHLLVAIMLLVMGYIIGGGLQALASEVLSYSDTINYIAPIAFAIPFAFAVYVYYLLFLRSQGLHYNFGFGISKWYLYPVMLLMFLGLMILAEPLANAIPTSGLNGILDQLWELLNGMEDMLNNYPVSSTFMIVILAPIFEELFFRGLILKGFLNNKMHPAFAIFASAFLFAFAHLNPWQFVGAFILGCALGFVYYKTQSLLNCMLLHFFNNSLGAIMFFSNNGEMEISDLTNSELTESLIYGFALFIIFGILFAKLTKSHQWKFY